MVKRLVWSRVCLWYHVCKTDPVQLVIVRDPSGREKDDFLVCTEPKIPEREVAESYFARWPIEVGVSYYFLCNRFYHVPGRGFGCVSSAA